MIVVIWLKCSDASLFFFCLILGSVFKVADEFVLYMPAIAHTAKGDCNNVTM